MDPLLSLLFVGVLLLVVSVLLFVVVIRRLRRGSRPAPAAPAPAPSPGQPEQEPTLRSYLRETAEPVTPPPPPPPSPATTRPTVVSRTQEPLSPMAGGRPARSDVAPVAPAPASEDRPIRILIVDDISDTREGLTKLLLFENDMEVVGTARTGREGVAAAHELEPDIVLMDINMPDMDGITAAETITREAPRSQLVMMSVQSDADYLRRSMLAGARDFLIKPFGTDDLVDTIHRVYQLGASRSMAAALAQEAPAAATADQQASRERRAYILTVYSPQPGAGCTTLATNLAVAMQQQADGLRIAVVDANFQFGDVGLFLNLQSTRTISDLASNQEDLDPEFVQDVMLPHSSGLRVLLAPPRPELADEVTPDTLRRILHTMAQVFDVIIIDSCAFLQETTLVSFELCDRLVLVATQEIPTVKNTKLFLEALDAMGFPLARLSLVLNRVDPRAGIDVADIQRSINHPLAGIVPWDWPLATYAVNRGVPFTISHSGSRLARGIQDLIPVLLTPPQAVAESSGA
ncbi:MAG: response regulator [Chloroflexi bacterium]|nr:response regulator [Chloroflexota bacterium]MBU1747957.1 response regulator [Chloroflexota bacterium]MBU1878825.1 response regulator [Chloroflexota bacterium]